LSASVAFSLLLATLKSHRARPNEERLFPGDAGQGHGLVFPSTIGTPQDAQSLLYRVFKRRLARQDCRAPRASTHARARGGDDGPDTRAVRDRITLSTILSTTGVYISTRQQIAQQYEAAFSSAFQTAAYTNRQQ
jgi:hypothetical protein